MFSIQKSKNILSVALATVFIAWLPLGTDASAPITNTGIPVEPVTVSLSHDSGTYDSPIDVEITALPSSAKAFYSLKDDAYGDDTFLATGSIRIERSGPLYYFAYTDPTNESKILKATYVIRFPGSAKIIAWESANSKSGSTSLKIRNDGTEPLNLANWLLTSLDGQKEIADQILAPGASTDEIEIPYNGEGVVILSDPNGDEREIFVNNPSTPLAEVKKPIITVPKATRKPSPGTTTFREFKNNKTAESSHAEIPSPSAKPQSQPEAATELEQPKMPVDMPPPESGAVTTSTSGSELATVTESQAKIPSQQANPNESTGLQASDPMDKIKINAAESGNGTQTRNVFFAILALITIGILGRIGAELRKGKK